MPLPEPSHGDILVQIGELKGQVATLITLVGQKREDINAAFLRLGVLEKESASHSDVDRVGSRVGVIEKELAKWVGVCLAVAFLTPVAMPQIQRALGVVEHRSPQQTERQP
jgi:hypothetical protein